MADPNHHQVIVIDDQMPMHVPGQHQNQHEIPYLQHHLMTADEQQNKIIWEEIDSPRRGSNSFAAISNAGAVQYQRLRDISRHLRYENNNLKVRSRELHNEAHARISAPEDELRQSHGRLDEAERQRIEAQQQLRIKQEGLGVSAAVVVDLTAKRGAQDLGRRS